MGSHKDLRRRAASSAIAEVGTLVIVEGQVAVQDVLHRRHTGEEAPTKLDAPQLGQDRALQALDEAVGPGMARSGPRVRDGVGPTGLIEGAPRYSVP